MSQSSTVRIAMWSGPRNISTAMMRSFENRADTAVWDEPLYGPYLHATGLPHPMAAEVIDEQGTDWRAVVDQCATGAPDGASVFYQKHMTHHLLDEISLGWLDTMVNCFLIRRPDEVLSSYHNKRQGEAITAEDLGFPQQTRIFDYLMDRNGVAPVVVDAVDVLRDPRATLGALCDRIGIAFSEQMLSWPAGRRDSDGVWSEHWYDTVWRSTAFAPYRPREISVPAYLSSVLDDCQPHYDQLAAHVMRA